jgi:hypothetical protein
MDVAVQDEAAIVKDFAAVPVGEPGTVRQNVKMSLKTRFVADVGMTMPG